MWTRARTTYIHPALYIHITRIKHRYKNEYGIHMQEMIYCYAENKSFIHISDARAPILY